MTLSSPECSESTASSGQDVCVCVSVYKCVCVCVPARVPVYMRGALIRPCLLMRATGGLAPRRADGGLDLPAPAVIMAVSPNAPSCFNSPLCNVLFFN